MKQNDSRKFQSDEKREKRLAKQRQINNRIRITEHSKIYQKAYQQVHRNKEAEKDAALALLSLAFHDPN